MAFVSAFASDIVRGIVENFLTEGAQEAKRIIFPQR